MAGRAAPVRNVLPPLNGFLYQADFISETEERDLLAAVGQLSLKEAPYKRYTAKRRILLLEPVPASFALLRDRVAAWMAMEPARFVHALVTEYRPGTQLGWHRDSPEYGEVAGISLLGRCRMRLRPYPHEKGSPGKNVLGLELEPRSAYAMQGEARWRWQHSIAATPMLRYSITFRTLRYGARAGPDQRRDFALAGSGGVSTATPWT